MCEIESENLIKITKTGIGSYLVEATSNIITTVNGSTLTLPHGMYTLTGSTIKKHKPYMDTPLWKALNSEQSDNDETTQETADILKRRNGNTKGYNTKAKESSKKTSKRSQQPKARKHNTSGYMGKNRSVSRRGY